MLALSTPHARARRSSQLPVSPALSLSSTSLDRTVPNTVSPTLTLPLTRLSLGPRVYCFQRPCRVRIPLVKMKHSMATLISLTVPALSVRKLAHLPLSATKSVSLTASPGRLLATRTSALSSLPSSSRCSNTATLRSESLLRPKQPLREIRQPAQVIPTISRDVIIL